MIARAIESILDKGSAHLKDEIMPRYAELIYNGYWFSPERILVTNRQKSKKGNERLKLRSIKETLVLLEDVQKTVYTPKKLPLLMRHSL